MKQVRKITAIGILFILAGCSSKEIPSNIYTLQTPSNILPATHMPYAGKSVQVMYPESFAERMGQNMHFSYSVSTQGKYLHSQWSEDTGKLLQGIILQSLGESGLFEGAVSYVSTVQADFRLESTVFAFSHRVRESRSDAVVSVQFALVSTQTGRLVKSKRFNYAIPTQTTDAKGYAKATNIAIERLVRDLLAWLNQNGV